MIGHKRLTRNMQEFGSRDHAGRRRQGDNTLPIKLGRPWVDPDRMVPGPVRTMDDMTPEELNAIQARLAARFPGFRVILVIGEGRQGDRVF